jgi:cobalt-zinc-cadmium efflux system outer membrane protein
MERRIIQTHSILRCVAGRYEKTVSVMAKWRTLGLFASLLFLAPLARSIPPEVPEENLPIAPRAVLPGSGPEKEDAVGDGLSLDAAVTRLVSFNYDLRTKYQDIPEARADELTASLRNPPAIFLSGSQWPYGRYSPQRPGTPAYEITPAETVDYSGKRKSHMREAHLATREIEARYQNAVRLEIDRLYDAYVDVLEGREVVRAVQSDLRELAELAALSREGPQAQADRIALRQFKAQTALKEAMGEWTQRKRNLAALLALPADKADELAISGSLDDRSPMPPPVEELIRLALETRPDLAAQRLGIEHDRAIVQVTRAERFDDAAVFWTPYEVQDNSPVNKKSSTGWGGGTLFALPLFDRNQGVIARAQINLQQRQVEMEGLERQTINDVRQAWIEYTASRQAVQQYEGEGVPAAGRVAEAMYRQYLEKKEGIDALLEARATYGEMARLYREERVRHRRAMLKVNTAVGKRILP